MHVAGDLKTNTKLIFARCYTCHYPQHIACLANLRDLALIKLLRSPFMSLTRPHEEGRCTTTDEVWLGPTKGDELSRNAAIYYVHKETTTLHLSLAFRANRCVSITDPVGGTNIFVIVVKELICDDVVRHERNPEQVITRTYPNKIVGPAITTGFVIFLSISKVV